MNKNRKDDNFAKTIGDRIRTIRSLRGMTQAELGKKVGLGPDRIQKYESANKITKYDHIEAIASGLGVMPETLTDPDINTPMGVIQILLSLEEYYNLSLKEENGQIHIYFDNNQHSIGNTISLNHLLKSWYDKWIEIHNKTFKDLPDYRQASKVFDYYTWSQCYPTYEVDYSEIESKEAKIQRLKEDIKILEKELKELEDN